MKLKQFIFAFMAMLLCFSVSVNAQTNVAKVGNTEYATINEAIANWTNGTTLTLLADVTLSDVVTLKSTEHHTLDLGTYTMTAANGKNAIEITCEGRSSASYAITVNADATNPGGITATGKACVYYSKSGSTKDRPIIRIYNGVFDGSYSINSKSNGNTNCPQVWIYGGTFNGNVNLTKNMLRVFGGTFNGWINCTGDSSAYREISGGRFKSWQFMTADADSKFWVGTSKANYNVGLYVDDEGYLVVGGDVITEAGDKFEASSTNYGGWSSYLKYSSAATNDLYYTSVKEALADNNTSTGSVTVYVDELDMAGISYKGTIVVPEGNDITITNALSTLKVQLADGTVLTPNANGTVATKLEVATLAELQAALASTTNVPIIITETIVIPEGETVVLDLNGKTVTRQDEANQYALRNLGDLTIKDTKGNGSINARGIYNGYGDGAANVASAIITVSGGTFNAKGTNGGAAIFNYGTANVNGGKFTSIGGYSLNNQAGAKMNITDGVEVTGGIYNNQDAELTVDGGNISNNRNGCHTIYAWNAKVTVNGGSIHNENSGNATIMSAGTSEVTINGGTISIKDGRVPGNGNTWTSCLTDAANTAKIIVNSGTFNGGVRVQGGATMTINGGSFNDVTGSGYNVYTGAIVEVKGGTFTDAAAQTFAKNNLAAGYELGKDGTVKEVTPAAVIGTQKFPTLQAAIEAVREGETITLVDDVDVTTPAYGQNALNHARAINFTLDLNGNTLSANTGNSVFRFNIANSGATSNVTLTIKNGKIVAGSNTWCAVMASGISADVKAIMNLEHLTIESSKANDMAVKSWANATINVKNVTVNATNAAGGFYAVGGEIVLDECTVNQKGLYTSPYMSMAFAVSSNGKMTVNSGTYSAEPTAAAEGNNQGSTHGSWVGGVMNSGGELIINGGTFSNGNFGDDALATAARGLIFADTNGKVTVSGGTFNALKSIFDFQNNLGGTSPVITVMGGSYSADPTKVTSYGSIVLDANYAVVENNDGVWTVVKAAAKIGKQGYATFADALAAVKDSDTLTLLADLNLKEILTINKAITFDGNGKTLTSTAARAINVDCNGNVGIKNLTINASGERAINVITKPANVTIENVTATAANYTVNVAASAGAAKVAITGSNLTGLNVVNVAAAGANVTIDNSTVNCNDNNTTAGESYAALCLNKAAVGASIVATNTTVNVTEGSDSEKGRNGAENGTVTINGSTEGVTVTVAVITYPGSDNYHGFTSLADAIEFAKTGDVVTLIRDITASGIITINKAITFDGNGKKLTSTAGRAINVSGADGVTIKNLTINASGERAINVIQNATNVTVENVTATAANYTVNVATSAPKAVVAISGSNLTGLNVVNVAAPQANVTINGGTITCNDQNEAENYAALALNKDAVGAKIAATGVTFDIKGDSKKAKNGAEGGEITIDGKTDEVVVNVAYIHNGGDYYYAYPSLEAAIANAKEGETITLLRDVTMDYNARDAYATQTQNVVINGNGKTLTLNQKNSDWASFGLANNSKLVLNNMTIEKTGYGDTSGAWNTHAIIFSCPVEMSNVTVNNAIAVQAGATLNKVTINEAYGYYGLWINGNGQTVTIKGGAIKATNGGRGIKIADQYIDAPAQVKLSVTGTVFETAQKAAVLVSSKAGANITASNVNIENVAEDKVNFIWVDEDWAQYFDQVEVNGATVSIEGAGSFAAAITANGAVQAYYKTLAEAINAAQAGATVELLADVTLAGGYDDAEEGLRIEKAINIAGWGHTIDCANFKKGIRVYNNGTTVNKVQFTAVTIVNNVVNGRCIDTRSANLHLHLSQANLIATNGNSQPLTIGGNDATYKVEMYGTKINAGNSGYGVICFVPVTNVISTSSSEINGLAAFYIKHDASEFTLNIGGDTYTGNNMHSAESGFFGTVVVEGKDNKINVIGNGAIIKAVAGNDATQASQAAFLIRGAGNTINFQNSAAQIVTEGANAYEVAVKSDIAASTKMIEEGNELKLVAENRGYQFYSFEEAVRFAGNEGTIKVVNDFELAEAWTVAAGQNVTLDLNGKTVSYTSAVAGEDMITNRGNLTITDSSDAKTGKLTYVNTDATASNVTVSTISSEPGSALNITGGTVENKTVKADGSSIYSFAIDMLTNGNLGDVTATIAGGTVYSDYMAIRQFNNGTACKNTLNITGGYIYGAKRAVQIHMDNNAAVTAISGGKIEAGKGGYALCNFAKTSALSVTDGEFIGAVYSASEKFISGGIYDAEVYDGYLANGYVCQQNENGTYGINFDPVAQIGDTYYATLRKAVEAAKSGETVKLLKDVTLEGGYDDAEEGLRIEKAINIVGGGHTIDCANFKKGIRVYNNGTTVNKVQFTSVTIVNNVVNGRCIDTRSANLYLQLSQANLTATNGNSQPLTIGGNDATNKVEMYGTEINAGNSGYGVICFVPVTNGISASSSNINGLAAFYIKHDASEFTLNIGSETYTGSNMHSAESGFFGTVVVEGKDNKINVVSNGAIIKAVAGNDATQASQAAFLIRGAGNTINFQNSAAQIVTEGANAYEVAVKSDIAASTKLIKGGKEQTLVAESNEYQFYSFEEAVRFAGNEGTIKVVSDIELAQTLTIAADDTKTLDLNGKTISANITEQLTKSFAAICNKGTLTVKDTTADGKISVSYAGNTFGYGMGLYTISNEGGVLNIEGGTIENLCTVSGSMYDAIDNNSTLGETVLNISGGSVVCEYIGIRQFANSTTANNVVNISGGNIKGGNTSIWMQNPNSKANKATLTITGADYEKNYPTIEGRLLAGESAGFVFDVKGGLFDRDVNDFCAPDYASYNFGNGTWGVESTNIESLDIVDGKLTEFVNQNEKTVGTLTYTRTFSSTYQGVWMALYVPFEIPVSELTDMGYEVAYFNDFRETLNADGEIIEGKSVIEMVKIKRGTLKANYPYAIKAPKMEDGTSVTLELVLNNVTLYSTTGERETVECSSATKRFTFSGTYKKGTKSDIVGSNDIPFYALYETGMSAMGETAKLGAFRVYMTITMKNGEPYIADNSGQAAHARAIPLRVIGEEDENGATIIYDVVEDSLNNNGDDYIYDLQGRRVSEPKKGGIYIKNGKKILY